MNFDLMQKTNNVEERRERRERREEEAAHAQKREREREREETNCFQLLCDSVEQPHIFSFFLAFGNLFARYNVCFWALHLELVTLKCSS